MHQGQNHVLVDISSNGGTRYPDRQPFEHQSQINIMVTIINRSHNTWEQLPKMGQFGHQH
jgi:hypothetical protein